MRKFHTKIREGRGIEFRCLETITRYETGSFGRYLGSLDYFLIRENRQLKICFGCSRLLDI